MGSAAGRAKVRGLGRRVGARRPKARFTIFCEGQNTEPSYLRCLGARVRNALVAVEVVGGVGTPFTIATAASAAKRTSIRGDSFEKNDETWAVFDRDVHPRFHEAIALCQREGVKVAQSNPCFEVWLLLHLVDYDRACDRHSVQRDLADRHAPYAADKRKLVDAEMLLADISLAEKRASIQCKRREQERRALGPPSTTVHLLTEAIRSAAGFSKEEARSKPKRRHARP